MRVLAIHNTEILGARGDEFIAAKPMAERDCFPTAHELGRTLALKLVN